MTDWLLRSVTLVLVFWLPGTAQRAFSAEVQAPDVFVRVQVVRDELELLRYSMGRPRNEQPELLIEGAAPREVFFQAITLFRKADRLAFEHTRQRIDEPLAPEGEIRPADVMGIVAAARQRILAVKQHLQIDGTVTPIERDETKTPTDVFRSIVQANRQLNLLLDRRFSPSDVFQQVTVGVSYASSLLARVPEATRLPDAPEFQPGKKPSDVYRRLVDCNRRIRRIARDSGLEMLQLEIDDRAVARAVPSDVYDIASLVVSELAHMHANLPDAQPPRKVYYPGRKFPSHVFQRVGILEAQLTTLESYVDAHPDWLRARAEE